MPSLGIKKAVPVPVPSAAAAGAANSKPAASAGGGAGGAGGGGGSGPKVIVPPPPAGKRVVAPPAPAVVTQFVANQPKPAGGSRSVAPQFSTIKSSPVKPPNKELSGLPPPTGLGMTAYQPPTLASSLQSAAAASAAAAAATSPALRTAPSSVAPPAAVVTTTIVLPPPPAGRVPSPAPVHISLPAAGSAAAAATNASTVNASAPAATSSSSSAAAAAAAAPTPALVTTSRVIHPPPTLIVPPRTPQTPHRPGANAAPPAPPPTAAPPLIHAPSTDDHLTPLKQRTAASAAAAKAAASTPTSSSSSSSSASANAAVVGRKATSEFDDVFGDGSDLAYGDDVLFTAANSNAPKKMAFPRSYAGSGSGMDIKPNSFSALSGLPSASAPLDIPTVLQTTTTNASSSSGPNTGTGANSALSGPNGSFSAAAAISAPAPVRAPQSFRAGSQRANSSAPAAAPTNHAMAARANAVAAAGAGALSKTSSAAAAVAGRPPSASPAYKPPQQTKPYTRGFVPPSPQPSQLPISQSKSIVRPPPLAKPAPVVSPALGSGATRAPANRFPAPSQTIVRPPSLAAVPKPIVGSVTAAAAAAIAGGDADADGDDAPAKPPTRPNFYSMLQADEEPSDLNSIFEDMKSAKTKASQRSTASAAGAAGVSASQLSSTQQSVGSVQPSFGTAKPTTLQQINRGGSLAVGFASAAAAPAAVAGTAAIGFVSARAVSVKRKSDTPPPGDSKAIPSAAAAAAAAVDEVASSSSSSSNAASAADSANKRPKLDGAPAPAAASGLDEQQRTLIAAKAEAAKLRLELTNQNKLARANEEKLRLSDGRIKLLEANLLKDREKPRKDMEALEALRRDNETLQKTVEALKRERKMQDQELSEQSSNLEGLKRQKNQLSQSLKMKEKQLTQQQYTAQQEQRLQLNKFNPSADSAAKPERDIKPAIAAIAPSQATGHLLQVPNAGPTALASRTLASPRTRASGNGVRRSSSCPPPMLAARVAAEPTRALSPLPVPTRSPAPAAAAAPALTSTPAGAPTERSTTPVPPPVPVTAVVPVPVWSFTHTDGGATPLPIFSRLFGRGGGPILSLARSVGLAGATLPSISAHSLIPSSDGGFASDRAATLTLTSATAALAGGGVGRSSIRQPSFDGVNASDSLLRASSSVSATAVALSNPYVQELYVQQLDSALDAVLSNQLQPSALLPIVIQILECTNAGITVSGAVQPVVHALAVLNTLLSCSNDCRDAILLTGQNEPNGESRALPASLSTHSIHPAFTHAPAGTRFVTPLPSASSSSAAAAAVASSFLPSSSLLDSMDVSHALTRQQRQTVRTRAQQNVRFWPVLFELLSQRLDDPNIAKPVLLTLNTLLCDPLCDAAVLSKCADFFFAGSNMQKLAFSGDDDIELRTLSLHVLRHLLRLPESLIHVVCGRPPPPPPPPPAAAATTAITASANGPLLPYLYASLAWTPNDSYATAGQTALVRLSVIRLLSYVVTTFGAVGIDLLLSAHASDAASHPIQSFRAAYLTARAAPASSSSAAAAAAAIGSPPPPSGGAGVSIASTPDSPPPVSPDDNQHLVLPRLIELMQQQIEALDVQIERMNSGTESGGGLMEADVQPIPLSVSVSGGEYVLFELRRAVLYDTFELLWSLFPRSALHTQITRTRTGHLFVTAFSRLIEHAAPFGCPHASGNRDACSLCYNFADRVNALHERLKLLASLPSSIYAAEPDPGVPATPAH